MGTGPVDVHAEDVDFFTTGSYKWLMAGFGVAAFYVRRELLNRIQPSNVGWHSARRLDNNRYQHEQTARKFEYATPAFGELYELAASLTYLRRIGLDRIEAQSQALVQRFRNGLAERKISVATPENNRSSIVSFYTRKSAAEATRILDAERVKSVRRLSSGRTRPPPRDSRRVCVWRLRSSTRRPTWIACFGWRRSCRRSLRQ
jgi:selenocysteine lyase/cysteine desulfurase